MRAREINRHFLDQADWVDAETTVDRVIIGDPETEVRRVVVTWIASFEACRIAVQRGADALMTHEPTFWVHGNELDNMETSPVGLAKRQFVETAGLVVLRNHDVWDRFPNAGIPWAWAQFLGFGDQPVKQGAAGYQHRYDIGRLSLDELAARVARRTAMLGEPAVQVVGEVGRRVSRVGIGTGCCARITEFQAMGCDVAIVCDDGSCYWRDIQRAADQEFPVIRVNHGTSEEPGMRTLTRYINEHLPGVEAEHLPHGSCFRLVGATGD